MSFPITLKGFLLTACTPKLALRTNTQTAPPDWKDQNRSVSVKSGRLSLTGRTDVKPNMNKETTLLPGETNFAITV